MAVYTSLHVLTSAYTLSTEAPRSWVPGTPNPQIHVFFCQGLDRGTLNNMHCFTNGTDNFDKTVCSHVRRNFTSCSRDTRMFSFAASELTTKTALSRG